MRVEANVSLRPRGTEPFGTRVEVKNMNSFRSVERAIAFEIERQAAALDAGETLTQETRGWDENRGETYVMRSKEDSHDYRYFPEPDLPPLRVDAAWLDEIRARTAGAAGRAPGPLHDATSGCPPTTRRSSSPSRARPSSSRAHAAAGASLDPKAIANWVTGAFLGLLKTDPEAAARVDPAQLADLVGRVVAGELSGTNAQGGLRRPRRERRAGRLDRRCPGLPPDLGHRRPRRDRRRGDRCEPGRRRRLPGGQAGHRLLRRPGDEGDARPGERRRRPVGRP